MTIIYAPAHPANYGGYGGRANIPRALVFHTPEEQPDEYEATPAWFQNSAAQASTHAYADNDGDRYEMVPDDVPAWACGTHGDRFDAAGNLIEPSNRHWKGSYKAYPPWGEPGISNNCLSLSMEVEGRAADLDMPEAQYQCVLTWSREKVAKYDIPIDLDHILGHGDLATDRIDPGPNFPWERLLNDLKGSDVQSVPLDQADTVAAFNRIANRLGAVMFDDAGESMEKVIDPPPPPGLGRVVVTYKL